MSHLFNCLYFSIYKNLYISICPSIYLFIYLSVYLDAATEVDPQHAADSCTQTAVQTTSSSTMTDAVQAETDAKLTQTDIVETVIQTNGARQTEIEKETETKWLDYPFLTDRRSTLHCQVNNGLVD